MVIRRRILRPAVPSNGPRASKPKRQPGPTTRGEPVPPVNKAELELGRVAAIRAGVVCACSAAAAAYDAAKIHNERDDGNAGNGWGV